MNDPDRIAELEAELAEVIADLKHKQRVNEDLKAENERLKQVCNCDLSNSAGVTIAGGRHSCGRIFVGSRVKELEAEVARLTALNCQYGDLAKMPQTHKVKTLLAENLLLSEQLGRCWEALEKIAGSGKPHYRKDEQMKDFGIFCKLICIAVLVAFPWFVGVKVCLDFLTAKVRFV